MTDLKLGPPVVTPPTVHLNGSGKDSLIDGYLMALSALRAASTALAAIAPHPRDFYVQRDPAAFQKAKHQHSTQLGRIERTIEEVEALGMAVMDQDKRG